MRRTIFEPEHEALRASAKEFLARSVVPRWQEFVDAKAFPRDLWIEAGKQGFLGLNIPEEYGGGGVEDWRFTVVVAEELARVSASLSSCLGIHSDVVAPYLVELTTPEQRERWLPRFCTGELVTAIGMTEPSGGSDLANLRDDGGPRRRRVRRQRRQDVHHQRLQRRPGRRRRADRPGAAVEGHHPAGGRVGHGGVHPGPQAGQGRPGRVGHRGAVLHRRPGAGRQRHRRGEPRVRRT